jgi:hypothetical protein
MRIRRSARVLAAGLAAATFGLVSACDVASSAARDDRARLSPAERLLADSAAGDSIALAALPARLRDDMDISALLDSAVLADEERARCLAMPARVEGEERRRLVVTTPDRGRSLLHVRARTSSAELRRVELARTRPDDAGERVLVWDAVDDELQSVEWEPGERRAGVRPVPAVLPRGGPAPRALRGLARRLLVLPCNTAHRIRIVPDSAS